MSGNSQSEERQKLASILAIMAAAFAGLGASSFFGEPWSLTTTLVVPLLGGVLAGAIEGSTARERALLAIPYAAGACVAAMATWLYTEGRSSIMNIELLLPMAAGLVPFFALRWVVGRLQA